MRKAVKDVLAMVAGGCLGWCITNSFLFGNITDGIVLLVGCAAMAALVIINAKE